MKRARRAGLARSAGFALLLPLVFAVGGRLDARAAPAETGALVPPSAAEKAIRRWSEGPRATARLMMAEYGPPDSASWRALRWGEAGPWAKIVVHRSAWPRIFGPRSRDWLEQTVSYLVPVKEIEEVQRFDDRIEINRPAAQMSSLSPDEATNTLLLNLAYEIAEGKRDARSAREFAARVQALAKEGKSSVYRERLLFPLRSKRSHAPAMVPGRPRGYTEHRKGGSHE